MSWKTVRIRALDSLLQGGSTPNEAAARGLPVLPPNTVAGFLRTLIGERKGLDWEYIARERIYSEPTVRGPLPMYNDEFVLPAPADAWALPGETMHAPPRLLRLTPDADPLRPCEGCDLPDYYYGMRPLIPPTSEPPIADYAFWRWAELEQWLLGETPTALTRIVPPEEGAYSDEENNPLRQTETAYSLHTVEYRTHECRPSRETPRCLLEWSLVARVRTAWQGEIAGVSSLGGERRLAYVEPYPHWLDCSERLYDALHRARWVRMYLATPAVFEGGWRPNWLQKVKQSGAPQLVGSPPELSEITLRLVAAAVPRRQAISGWSLRTTRFGPRPTNWCAPAGSVYFFEVLEGDAGVLADRGWLLPVSDGKQQNGRDQTGDRARDAGFGLALWGVWKPTPGRELTD
ncbi:MAG: type III-B CRISPR module-associated protein Cmr3 [Fimbriimonadales bacterium]|nr:type III-B CRISPR module-associated protein Cmr3 [Fimbriimonadales bacterium]